MIKNDVKLEKYDKFIKNKNCNKNVCKLMTQTSKTAYEILKLKRITVLKNVKLNECIKLYICLLLWKVFMK